MDYKLFFTHEDIQKRGYNFNNKGRLAQGDFASIEDAINDFLQEVFDSVYDLIESYKGSEWTELFFEDMSADIDKSTYPQAYKKQKALKWALIEQVTFIYENGDILTSSKIEIDKIGYSQKVIRKLWDHYILR